MAGLSPASSFAKTLLASSTMDFNRTGLLSYVAREIVDSPSSAASATTSGTHRAKGATAYSASFTDDENDEFSMPKIFTQEDMNKALAAAAKAPASQVSSKAIGKAAF